VAAIDEAAQRFQAEIGRDSGLATEGLAGVTAALRSAAVETLIVGEIGDATVVAGDDIATVAPNPNVLSELGTAPTQVLRADFEPAPESVPLARRAVLRTLVGRGLDRIADTTCLLTSELVTNALRHGARGSNGRVRDGSGPERVELILLRRPGQMVCAVTDRGAEPPVLARPDPSAEEGRGLRVVEALAATWGWTRLGTHKKAVWATLTAPVCDGGNGHLSRPALSRARPPPRRQHR